MAGRESISVMSRSKPTGPMSLPFPRSRYILPGAGRVAGTGLGGQADGEHGQRREREKGPKCYPFIGAIGDFTPPD